MLPEVNSESEQTIGPDFLNEQQQKWEHGDDKFPIDHVLHMSTSGYLYLQKLCS